VRRMEKVETIGTYLLRKPTDTREELARSACRLADAIGATLTLLLRPERFRVASVGDAGHAVGNRFSARVRDVTYLGEDLHLRVLASEREPLLVAIKNSKDTRAMASGAAIDLVIDPEDIHVLRR